jgi:hypothetical protein
MIPNLNTSMLNPLSFSHGQTQSKLWLCEQLEPYLPNKAVVAVLGCWHNLQGFLLVSRDKNRYQSVLGLDVDPNAIYGANQLCEGFMIGDDSRIRNEVQDVNDYNFQGFHAVINCSVEHMSNEWFLDINPNVIVCIQTSNVTESKEPWFITNPTTSFQEFRDKFPMSETMFEGVRSFDYGHFSYERYMIIGRK